MDRITGVQLFIRVVETGSFSKAAGELGISQPTATKSVAATEARLGARLLHRSTRGVTATEVGALYYQKRKLIAREIDEADNLASLLQSQVGGLLRISTSVAFGRRTLVPLVLRYMRQHPGVMIDLGFDDRYVNLVEQGIDLAVRMGRLADSNLGARYLGHNPWVMVAAPAYLQARGTPHAAQRGRPGGPRLPGLQQRAGRRPLGPDRARRLGAGAGGQRPAALEQSVGGAGRHPRRPGPGGVALLRGA